MPFKLTANADGTATVCDDKGFPLSLAAEEGQEPEPVTVALDGFAAVEPADPLASLADNPHIRALQERLEKAEAAAVRAERDKAEATISAAADRFRNAVADRFPGKRGQDARAMYAALLAHDHAHPPAAVSPGLAAQFEAIAMACPPIDTAEHAAAAVADGEAQGDGTVALENRQGGAKNALPDEAQVRAAMAGSPDPGVRAVLADPAKFSAHLARLRADGLAK